eukprot:TRINITY_DN38754_c0_g1_i1.p1 TRINITY_DN38754_c0_g1~~TRINITY_DN38754_c0_g1_i1.p1  ORF type:complete len:313 (+),score=29.58 TRINITY_DN38754_c0_g1_i1:72-941(+)
MLVSCGVANSACPPLRGCFVVGPPSIARSVLSQKSPVHPTYRPPSAIPSRALPFAFAGLRHRTGVIIFALAATSVLRWLSRQARGPRGRRVFVRLRRRFGLGLMKRLLLIATAPEFCTAEETADSAVSALETAQDAAMKTVKKFAGLPDMTPEELQRRVEEQVRVVLVNTTYGSEVASQIGSVIAAVSRREFGTWTGADAIRQLQDGLVASLKGSHATKTAMGKANAVADSVASMITGNDEHVLDDIKRAATEKLTGVADITRTVTARLIGLVGEDSTRLEDSSDVVAL